ncbi:uncharacterized protein A1O9_01403 [Exophiala aquamarina CBS 119918]|uniref:FAD-binding domain-containing protein n=1 Tax=Exophiala aquamarina CBS 119918 TaxID=1182545 RepID=A0A072Q675_9EURO|nr:uncharacterized protein A1O9_01403 [Exophiala aquamarina CBS 119918]KEF63425.1 hypothetical protein A1O9_01403 [Exophiala aquamarina CBS 119918]
MKVLISGGGIAGPCLAYWLARTRLDIVTTIVERSPFPRLTGQSVDVRGTAVDIVRKMGLEEAVRARHTTEEGTIMIKRSGKGTFAHFKAGDVFTADYEILRADLSQLFLEATQSLTNVRYMYGDSIISLEQTEKDVNITFASGSKDTFDLVVAADGSTSATRPMILDEQSLKGCYNFLGQYIAFYSIPKQKDDPKLWQIYNPARGLCIMIRPHKNTSTMGVYLCVTTPSHSQRDPAIEEAMKEGPEATKKKLWEYFKDLGWQAKRVLEGMNSAEDFYFTRAAQVKLPKWTNQRGVVMGDAAFATFGVGTTLAISSAYTLAGELSKIKNNDDVPHALEKYEQVFRTLYAKMEDLPPGYPQIVFPQSAWAIRLRDFLIWVVSATKAYKLIPGEGGVDFALPPYEWGEIPERK